MRSEATSFQELETGFDKWWDDCGGAYIQSGNERSLVRDYARAAFRAGKLEVLASRAALARERELREALLEGVEILKLSPPSNWLGDPEYISWLDHVEALLAQPAAGEERERG